MGKNIDISIIITTKNSARTLEPLLESITKQTHKGYEIIVVDNASTDNTLQVSKNYTKHVYTKGPERSTQRNYGAEKSNGKYLLFLDSDMVLTPRVLSDCMAVVTKSEYGGVVIPEVSFGEGLWAKAKILEREINAGENYFEAARFFPVNVFHEFGGYDTNLTGPEDWDLPQRIAKKYEIGRTKAHILHNEGRPTLTRFVKRKYYYGLTVHSYLRKHSIPLVSSTTVYFLRPAFYKHWRKIVKNPLVGGAMVVMLLGEMVGGAIGYIQGRLKHD